MFNAWPPRATDDVSPLSLECARRSPNRARRFGPSPRRSSASSCVAELLQRTNLDGKDVEALVFGTVVPSVLAPNIAREVSLLPLLPKGVQAVTVSRACASANQAITDAADQIALGHADVAIAGGAESLSNVPILHSRGICRRARRRCLNAPSRRRRRLDALARIRPRDLVPITPAIAEPSTGETMGAVGGEDGEDQSHLARGAGPVRAALAPARRGGHRTMVVSPPRSMAVYVPPKFETRVHDATTASARTRARAAAGAQAGVRPAVRHGDRRQLVAAHRRRRAPCCS